MTYYDILFSFLYMGFLVGVLKSLLQLLNNIPL
mgnify:FL=1